MANWDALEFVLEHVASFGTGVLFVTVILLILYFTQDRASRAGKFLGGVLRGLASMLSSMRRLLQRLRLQRKVNKVLKRGTKERPFIAQACKFEWQNTKTTRDEFLEEVRYVVALPRDFNQHESFVRTVYLFVSRSLLPKSKRLLDDAQRAALNLYYTSRILEACSEKIADQFHVDYVADQNLDARTSNYLGTFDFLERRALFEDILIRELEHSGGKVLLPQAEKELSAEVDALIDMLATLGRRRHGELVDMTLERTVVRCGLVIIGKREKIAEDPTRYAQYVRRSLLSRQLDSIYVLCDSAKEIVLESVIHDLEDSVNLVRRKARDAIIFGQDCPIMVSELRAKDASAISSGVAIDTQQSGFSAGQSANDVVDVRSPGGRLLGTILFISEEGWGFIEPDDPAVVGDIWFREKYVVNRPPILDSGDRVEMRIVRDSKHRRLRASEVIFIRSSDFAQDVPVVPAPRPVEGFRPETRVSGVDPSKVDALRSAENSERNHSSELAEDIHEILLDLRAADRELVPLSQLGGKIRERRPTFSHLQYGRRNLLALVGELAEAYGLFCVGHFPNGHPYVSVLTHVRDDVV